MERSLFQQKAELSRFDDSAVRERREAEKRAFDLAAQQAQERAAVPGTDQVVYEPENNKSDWAGLVRRDELERTHFRDHVSQRESVMRTDDGILPREDVNTLDYRVGDGKKHYENDVRFQSSDAPDAPLFADPTYFKPHGQDDRFQSVYQAQTASVPTSLEMMKERCQPKGKRRVTPLHEQSLNEVANRPRQSLSVSRQEPEDGRLFGYRAAAFKHGAPSMLASIGAQVAQKAPSRTSEGTPSAHYPRDRSGILENYRSSSSIPGYTGMRR